MTVKSALAALEQNHLIVRERQGAGKPSKIFVLVQTENCPPGGTSPKPQMDRKLSGSNKQSKNQKKTYGNYVYEEGESL